jgi:AhpD family alkylhydroperoxidase
MNRLVQPATNKVDFELFSTAVSAINGCETCIRAHEKAVTDGGLTPDHVNDAVRIAPTCRPRQWRSRWRRRRGSARPSKAFRLDPPLRLRDEDAACL